MLQTSNPRPWLNFLIGLKSGHFGILRPNTPRTRTDTHLLDKLGIPSDEQLLRCSSPAFLNQKNVLLAQLLSRSEFILAP